MLPLDRDLLMFIKIFVVLTCVFFWIRLVYLAVMRHVRMRRRGDYE